MYAESLQDAEVRVALKADLSGSFFFFQLKEFFSSPSVVGGQVLGLWRQTDTISWIEGTWTEFEGGGRDCESG